MSPRSTRILAVAAAITVLHVVDEATLHREPGTSIADNAAGAGVIIGLITVGAIAFPPLRVGAQAVLAVLLGVLAATLGTLPLVEVSSRSGTTWDALMGVSTAAAGATAIVVALLALWRSRRRDGRRVWRWLRRGLIVLGAAIVAQYLLLPVVLAIVVTNRPREDVAPADLGRRYETVSITSSDGLRLGAWYVPSENGAAVITFPRRGGAVDHARMLARHGYGVLLVDARGYDSSEGKSNVFGWGSGKDLDGAVDYLAARDDVRPTAIGGLGLSVGGEQLLDAAAHDTRLAAVVSDGAGYRTLHEARLATGTSLETLLLAVALGAVRVLSPEPYPEPLDELVSKIAPRALMLIEAENGQGGEENNSLYYERAGQPKVHWVVQGAGHTGGLDTHPEEYERRVIAFLDRYLLGYTS